jgi:hypothetical protein
MEVGDLVISLLSGLLGGSVIAAVVSHYLKKRETGVFLDKMKAETDKTRAETELIKRNLQNVQSNVSETAHIVQKQQSQLKDQRDIIDKLVLFSMSGFIFGHLEHILNAQITGQPYTVDHIDKVQDELRFLKDHGYIWDFDPSDIRPGRNIAEVIRLTDIAQWFVQLRLETEKREREI